MPKWTGSVPDLLTLWTVIINSEVENHYVYLCIPEGVWELGKYLSLNDARNDVDDEKMDEFLRQPDYWRWIERAYEEFFSEGLEDYQQRGIYGYYAGRAQKWDIAYEQFHKSKMKFESCLGRRSRENMLIMYTFVCLKTGHDMEALEVGRVGLEMNHCPHCNTQFQKYIDIAEAKLKKR